MQPATTFTIASVGAAMAGTGTSESRMSPGPWMVVARMPPSLQHPVRPAARDAVLHYLISEIPWSA